MKRIIATALLAALPFAVQADDDIQAAMEICSSYEDLAENIMSARQNGVGMSEMMAIADGDSVAIAMVTDAFNQPSYSTDSVQQSVIRDFADEVASECYRVLLK